MEACTVFHNHCNRGLLIVRGSIDSLGTQTFQNCCNWLMPKGSNAN